MIIKVLDKLLGVLVGAVTGCLTVIWQVPLAYYLFARTMRQAKYSWFTTLLATLTVGHIAALISSAVSLLVVAASPVYGMMIGFQKGLLGALTLPLNLSLEIDKYSVFMLMGRNENGQIKWMGTEGIWEMIKQFIFFGAFSFAKIDMSSLTEDRMNARYRIYQIEELLWEERHRIQSSELTPEEIDAGLARIFQLLDRVNSLQNSPTARHTPEIAERLDKNRELIDMVKSRPVQNTTPFPCLEDKEIAEFKSVIDAEKDAHTKKKNSAIYDYITSHCLISLEPLSELNNKLKDAKEQAVPPITVVGTFPDRSYVRTYDYESFVTYLEAEKNKTRPIAVIGGAAANGDPLEDKEHIAIYRGFYPVDVAYIRAEIKRGKKEEKKVDIAYIQAEIKREEEKGANRDAPLTKIERDAKQVKAEVASIQPEIKKEKETEVKKNAWLTKIEGDARQARERQSQAVLADTKPRRKANSYFPSSLSSNVATQGATVMLSSSTESSQSLRIANLHGHLFAPRSNNPSQSRKLSENRVVSKL